MPPRHFYDLPVYRLPREQYNKAREEYIEQVLFPPDCEYTPHRREREKADNHANTAMRDHLWRAYGGCWDFNEVIAQVRLHFLGSQVRGEYFAVVRKRIVRTRTKTLEFRTWKLVPEIEIREPFGTAEVLFAIREYLERCAHKLQPRCIDTSLFDAIAPFVNWGALYAQASRPSQ